MATANVADLQREIEALKAQLASKSRLSCKVSDKGAVSVYGLGRFPVTLYAEQWERLEAFMPTVSGFITEHRTELKSKE